MGFGDDDDILQDFLVEAGEILELLSEQLVDLEQRPDDANLLNAIFRGFHTVKGGAGFLQLNAMVECCHVTENLFDILRNGKRTVTSELMDVVLQALDCVNQQFQEVSQRQELTPATPQLLSQLERLVSCADLTEAATSAPAPVVETTVVEAVIVTTAAEATIAPTSTLGAGGGQGDITDSEFEELLDAISGVSAAAPQVTGQADNKVTAPPPSTASDDAISEDEFEALLDQLHGSGKGPGVGKVEAAVSVPAPASTPAPAASSSDEITDDEFEALLDQLHGSGKAPTVKSAPAAAAPVVASGKADDQINEDEFEALLDQLHGVGKSPTKNVAAPAAPAAVNSEPPKPASAVKPAAKAKPAVALKAESTVTDDVQSAAKTAAPDSPAAGAATETTVRVDTQRLDDIMNMVGELVLVRNRLVRLGLDVGDEALSKAVSNLDVVTADLQTSVMKTRMQPIKKVFGRFPRVVRDLARHLKKEINLELLGEETDLDKNLVEALADPLVHLVRNSVDHGIEMPADREAKGKSRVGKVILAAQQEGDHILLSIIDDGGGMDPNMLKARAVAKGILEEDTAARMSDSEAFALIFAPGFSTKDQISDISGRGVGMDVVKTKISQLNGSIEIKSKPGEGTSIIIKVPLTLAIMPTLMIMLGRQTFALPLVSVNEIFHMDLSNTNVVDGQECVIIRERAVPIYHLKRWLVKDNYRLVNGRQDGLHEAHVVVVSVGTQRVGFVVDQLIGQEEVVIKPLGKMLQGTPGMAGATITGDGTIALILDVPSMLKRYAGHV